MQFRFQLQTGKLRAKLDIGPGFDSISPNFLEKFAKKLARSLK